MSKTGWIVAAAIVVGGTVYATHSCQTSVRAPDRRLAGQFEDLCSIARKNVDKPVRGVKQLGSYLTENTGEMLANLGDTITMIEQITDDQKHDDRAYVARDRIWKPWIDCMNEWEQFLDAVENDEKANAMMTRALDRLDRTLGIIFSGKHVDVRQLPAALLQLPTGSETSR